MSHIVWISDMDAKGSGYLNLSIPLCSGLVTKGHDVRVVGLAYDGSEHPHNFSIIPARNLQEVQAIVINLHNFWKVDVLIVALDIPLQEMFLSLFQNRPFKYVGIMPIEADPLCMSWAMVLLSMNKAMIISQFGTDEAMKVGVPATHIQLGIDIESWRRPKNEEISAIKSTFGFDDDTFVVLTVADNQERKNLSKAMEIFSKFSKGKKAKYILVTRARNMAGWKLMDLAQEYGIHNDLVILERGMGFAELWGVYAIADAFLISSKAEGLGLPLLEAMAVGVPCVATNCTGMAEVLGDGRGLLAKYEYKYRDPFGNGNRYFISASDAVRHLNSIYDETPLEMINKARKYVEGRTWDIAVAQLDAELKKLEKPNE